MNVNGNSNREFMTGCSEALFGDDPDNKGLNPLSIGLRVHNVWEPTGGLSCQVDNPKLKQMLFFVSYWREYDFNARFSDSSEFSKNEMTVVVP